MTDELTCTDCGEALRVERQRPAGLQITCSCPDRRYGVKVATRLPEVWSA